MGFSEEELKNLAYQERCNLLNNTPVLVAKHFHYKVEVILKKSYLMVHWEKKYYAIPIELTEKGSPLVHSFLWIFNAPNIQDKTAYTEFNEKK